MVLDPNVDPTKDPPKDPPKDGGGGGDDLQAKIDAAVAIETSGLRAKRDQLLANEVDLKKKFSSLNDVVAGLGGEEGIQRLVAFRETLEKDEMGKLISEGKHEEWHEKKVAALKTSFQKEKEKLLGDNEGLKKSADHWKSMFETQRLDIDIRSAAVDLEMYDTAITDALNRASGVFSYDQERKQNVIVDGDGDAATIVLGSDGINPKTVAEWLAEQRETARHWFKSSQGADASGNVGPGRGNGRVDASKLSFTEHMAVRHGPLGIRKGTGVKY